MFDDKGYFAESCTVSVKKGKINDGMSVWIDRHDLFQPAKATAHSCCEDDKCRFFHGNRDSPLLIWLFLHGSAAVIVEAAFPDQGRTVHMPRINLIIALERADLPEGLQHIFHAPAVKIGSAAAAAEERVAGEERILSPNDDTSGCMPGGGEDRKVYPGGRHHITVIIGPSVFRESKREVEGMHVFRVILRIHVNGCACLLLYCFHCSDMVIVPVGEEDGFAGEMIALQIVEYGVAFITRIDDNTLKCFFVGYNIAVGLKVSDRERFDQHDYSSFVSSRMVTGPSF